MPDITVSADVDEFMQSADYAGARTALGVTRNQYIKIVDRKASLTAGGGAVGSTAHIRDLNAIDVDETGGASLSTNRITLLAGDYRISVTAPTYIAGSNRIYLYNQTDGAELLGGEAVYSSNSTTLAPLRGKFTTDGTKAFEIRHWVQLTRATDGLGVAPGDGSPPVYTVVELWRY